MTKADRFVEHMINRVKNDGRLAYLISPMSEGYELMTDAFAERKGIDADEFRKYYQRTLRPEKVLPATE